MIRWIAISILTIGLFGTAFWGYQEHQDKNAILIQAENTYQRAFHELSYYVDLLYDKVGSSLAMNSRDQLSPQLVEIWRLTSEAHANVGQLPLSLLPFNKTEEFLSNIGDFTYRVAVRDLDEDPLNDDEIDTLENLYKQAGEIKDELRQVQYLVLKNNLRWMDVQLALATNDEPFDNTIIDGFKTVEEKVEGYTETNVDTLVGDHASKKEQYLLLGDEQFTEKEIIEKSKDIFQIKNEKKLDISKSGEGSDIPFYSVSYRNEDKNAYMDITEQGAHPITILVDRPVSDKKLSLHDGFEKAKEYLTQFDFDDMTALMTTEYDDIGVYSFIYNQRGIRVHPDTVEIKVALDNGDILGLSAKTYFMNHRERDIPNPELSEEAARNKVNANVRIEEQFLSVIENDLGEEVLTYEFLGVMNDNTYRIFINAMDGKEEKVEKLRGTEINFSAGF